MTSSDPLNERAGPDPLGDEFAADFERAAALVRAGDTEGLAAHANRFAEAEAAAAMERAGLPTVKAAEGGGAS